MKTKKIDVLTKRVNDNKELMKRINSSSYYSVESFIQNAQRYIKAISDGRVICSIGSVSASGMSRTIKFLGVERNTKTKKYQYLNFYSLFKQLGYSESGKTGYFRINGCGMDMIFNTNYNNIHNLYRLGFISKKECDSLCQMTPSVI